MRARSGRDCSASIFFVLRWSSDDWNESVVGLGYVVDFCVLGDCGRIVSGGDDCEAQRRRLSSWGVVGL